jgi:hypothetical protein
MLRTSALVVVLLVGVSALLPAALACGDKFLMVGRGAKFQRAYASVHPGKILIYARPSTDAKAAIRDPQLHKALRQAGHAVSVIEDWALLETALKTAPTDVVLVDVGEAARLQAAIEASPTPPDALFVAFPHAMPPADVICRLKSSDKTIRFLDEVENAMKARSKRAKVS